MEKAKYPSTLVFLGGSCGNTTWRQDIIIPVLDKYNIQYFNPQVPNWTPECIAIENNAKKIASDYIFYIDSNTPSLASVLEILALPHIYPNRKVYVTIELFKNSSDENLVKDINRARLYLIDAIKQMTAIKQFPTLKELVKAFIDEKTTLTRGS